jgi:TP901 family phage tail tape measure protein
MPTADSTVRIKADISKLKSEMQAAARQVRVVNSEFKAATAGMEDWTKSEAGLTAKIKQLNGVLDGQKKKLELLNQELEKTKELDEGDTAAIDRLKIAINNQQAAIAKTEKELGQYNQALEELPKTLDDTGDAAEKASEGFTVMKAALANLIADGIRAGINALKDFAQEAIQVGMDYESAMSKVGAVSGASAEEMQQLSDKAKEMGESTIFSASQSAEAFNYMAMAGWKTEEMLDGIEGIMNLAAASGADLATTSDIVTDALTAMGYGAKDAGRLADVMAAASSNANTNVEMMGSTFQYAAPIIGTLGMSMEDAAVAIGLMANAGIKGDKAGTALRSTLNRLSAPPKECAEEMEKLGLSLTDSDGKMKSLNQVMIELRGAFQNLSETEATAAAKHIAGQEAMSGLLAIVNASDKDFQKLTMAVNNSAGAAEKMANTMNDNVGGQLTLLKSKIEGIMIKLFERASASMKKGIETVGQALDKVDWNKVGDQVAKFATKAADFFAYLINNSPRIISALKVIGTAFATIFVAQKISSTVTAITSLITVIKGASSASALLTSAMGALGISMSALPIMAVVAGAGALYAYTKKQQAETEALIKANYGLTDSQQEMIEKANESAEALRSVNEARKAEGQEIDIAAGKLTDLKDKYNSLIDENGNVKEGSEELAQVLLGELAEGLGTTIDNIKENIDANGKLSASIDELIQKKKQELKLAAFEDDYNQALKDEVENFKALKNAKEEDRIAQEKKNEAEKAYLEAKSKYEDEKGDYSGQNLKALNETKAAFDEATAAANETSEAYRKHSDVWASTQSTIEFYNKAMEASYEGDAEAVNNALISMQNGFADYTTASKKQLEDQVTTTKQDLELIREMYNEGTVNESVLRDQEAAFNISKKLLDDWVDKNDSASAEAAKALGKNTSDGFVKMQEAVEELSGNTRNSLDNDLGDWGEIADKKTDGFLNSITSKLGNVEKASANFVEAGANAAEENTKTFVIPGEKAVETVVQSMEGKHDTLTSEGEKLPQIAADAATANAGKMKPAGEEVDNQYASGIDSNTGKIKTSSEGAAKVAVDGVDTGKKDAETSGENFVQGFINGIGNLLSSVYDAGKKMVSNALSGARDTQKEGSPSKVTFQSGEYFVQGYVNGIGSLTKKAYQAAASMTMQSIKAVRVTQQEGSPSKLTYESGRMFTQGLINGMVSLESQLVTTTKGLVTKTLAELLKLENFNFSEVTANASSAFSSGFQKQLDYMIDRITYENQQKVKDFDTTVKNLQDAADAEVQKKTQESQKKQNKIQKKIEKNAEKEQTKSTKAKAKKLKKQLDNEKKRLDQATDKINEAYDKQIEEQKNMKESYQEASSAMIKEFTQAMQEYQTAAQKLIDDTMNKIADDYQSQYDALISKQDNLISKLKSAGDLFNVSGANVMTINDIKAQTESIKQYASKLQKIKEKVSGDLFDQIASYDMDQGEAFIDKLLSMTDEELKAYSDAYDEKMKVSEELGKGIYKSDFDKIAANYKTAMEKAFKDLPKQLEDLGWQSMKGFLQGLTGNTDYMTESVKTFIAGMVDTFKKQLGIHSPSKVTMNLGELCGEGFADGLRDMVKTVQKAAKDVTNAVKDNLDLSADVSAAKNLISNASGSSGLNRSTGAFVGDKTQNIIFNQYNNSPKALDRLTIYRQTNNALFSAKVGLSNV